MSERPRGRRRGATPEQILSVAREHAIRNGWRATRVQAIAADVGISRPTLYKAFPSKQDLAVALVAAENARVAVDLRAALSRAHDVREGIRIGVGMALDEAARNPLLAVGLGEASEDGSLLSTIVGPDTIVQLMSGLIEEIFVRVLPDQDPGRLAFLAEVIPRLTFSYAHSPGRISGDELADSITDLAMSWLEG